MKTYTIGTSWKRLLAVSAVLSAVMTGYPGATLATSCPSTWTPSCGAAMFGHCSSYYQENNNGTYTKCSDPTEYGDTTCNNNGGSCTK